MNAMRRNLTVALGVAALALPAAAVASQGEHGGGPSGEHGKGHSKTHKVAYVFKGAYAGESTVTVASGNGRVRKGGFIEQTVAFDFSAARITVADKNGDQTTDLNDVEVGDKVLVKAMLPKADPGAQPFAAQRLVDQTHPEAPEAG